LKEIELFVNVNCRSSLFRSFGFKKNFSFAAVKFGSKVLLPAQSILPQMVSRY